MSSSSSFLIDPSSDKFPSTSSLSSTSSSSSSPCSSLSTLSETQEQGREGRVSCWWSFLRTVARDGGGTGKPKCVRWRIENRNPLQNLQNFERNKTYFSRVQTWQERGVEEAQQGGLGRSELQPRLWWVLVSLWTIRGMDEIESVWIVSENICRPNLLISCCDSLSSCITYWDH